jgi:hypothetical protein
LLHVVQYDCTIVHQLLVQFPHRVASKHTHPLSHYHTPVAKTYTAFDGSVCSLLLTDIVTASSHYLDEDAGGMV